MTDQETLIDFDNMSDQQKREKINHCILKVTNFKDITATTLDWSTSSMQLYVLFPMVLSFIRSLDFDRICRELTGVITVKQMFQIAFSL